MIQKQKQTCDPVSLNVPGNPKYKKQPTYKDLTKLMFTNGNPKTDKNLKIES